MISNEKNAKKANLTSQIILCSIPILNFVSQPYAFYKIGKLRQFLIYYATVISISSSLIVAGNLRQELEILKIYGLVFIFVAGYIFPIIWVFFWTKKFNREVQAENLWRINEAQKNHLKKIDERRIFDSQKIGRAHV